MKYKFILPLLIVTLLGLSLVYGCGGGNDGITTPSSITTGGGETDNITETTGSLSIKVNWPQDGIEGSFVFASGSNEFTASDLSGVDRIDFEIFEEKDYPDTKIKLAGGSLVRPPDNKPSTLKIELLPAIKIKVEATLYKRNNETLSFEKTMTPIVSSEFQIVPGDNSFHWEVGEIKTYLNLSSEIEISEETEVTASLKMEGSGIEDQPSPDSRLNEGILESQGECGLQHYDVKFTIISSIGELLPKGSTTPQAEVIETTDAYGNASAIVRSDTEGTVTVQAEFQLSPSEVVILTQDIEVKGDYDYSLGMALSHDKLPSVPDLEKESEITVNLTKTSSTSDSEPVSEKQVDFELEIINRDGTIYSGTDIFLSSSSEITNSQGEAQTSLICNAISDGMSKTVTIKAEVEVGTPDNPETKTVTKVVKIGVYDISTGADYYYITTTSGVSHIFGYLELDYGRHDSVYLEGKTINFSIGSDSTTEGELIDIVSTTDSEGCATATLKPVTDIVGTVAVKAEFIDGSYTCTSSRPIHLYPRFNTYLEFLNKPTGEYEYYKPGDTVKIKLTRYPTGGFSPANLPVHNVLENNTAGHTISPEYATTGPDGEIFVNIELSTSVENVGFTYVSKYIITYDNVEISNGGIVYAGH